MTQAKTLLVHGQRIAVSDEVYKAYYQCHERARYLPNCAMTHEASLERLQDAGMMVESHLMSVPQEDDSRLSALRQALSELDEDTREMIWQLVLGETTERALAERLGVSKTTLHRRKERALSSLRARILALTD